MKTHVGSSRAAISAVLLLLTIGFSIRASAKLVELSNDVVVSSANRSHVKHPVFGAPRLVADAQNAADRLRIEIITTASIPEQAEDTGVRLTLGVVDPLTLQPIIDNRTIDRFPLTFTCKCDQKGGSDIVLTSEDFSDFDGLPEGELIFTVAGEIGKHDGATVTITLSGPGRELLIDRVGNLDELDTHTGRDADDTPPQSMAVVRALARIEAAPGRNRGVELDIAAQSGADVNRVVGFTHAFDFDPDAGIQDAVLRFRVTSDVQGSASDYILLESAVRDVAAGTPVPIVAFCHLPGFSAVPGEAQDLRINLRRVPVAFRYPSPRIPCPPRVATLDLLPDLRDRRLNVIVGDHSKVDFSDLLIFIKR